MRLQKRHGRMDEFSEAEKRYASKINPKTWNGILVRGLCIYEDQRFVLKDLNFAVASGEMFGVFGKECKLYVKHFFCAFVRLASSQVRVPSQLPVGRRFLKLSEVSCISKNQAKSISKDIACHSSTSIGH